MAKKKAAGSSPAGEIPPGLSGKVGVEAVETMLGAQAAKARGEAPPTPAAAKKKPTRRAKAGAKKTTAKRSAEPAAAAALDPAAMRGLAQMAAEAPFKLVQTYLEIKGLPDGPVGDRIRDLWSMDEHEKRMCGAAVEVLIARHGNNLGHNLPWLVLGTTIGLGAIGRVVMGRRILDDARRSAAEDSTNGRSNGSAS